MSLQAATPRLVLASASAARRALLAAAGVACEIMPSGVDEVALKAVGHAEEASPDAVALMLAGAKARAVARRNPDALVIGSDQILVCGETWFDKPADRDEARAHLRRLRGQTHVLHTAVVCRRGGAMLFQHVARPALTMRAFSDAFLETYLDLEGTNVTASVGAYRLEGPGVHLFARIEGEQAAILGLPMLALLEFLRTTGVLAD